MPLGEPSARGPAREDLIFSELVSLWLAWLSLTRHVRPAAFSTECIHLSNEISTRTPATRSLDA